MSRKRIIPVYLFTGFLDCGKTSFIKQTMDEGQFKDGKTTLFVVCEEGEEEIDEVRLKENKFVVKKIEDEDDVTEELLEGFDLEAEPGRVIIESNGMWDIDEMLDSFPANWELAEVITPIDSTTFEMYLNNMKMMMTNQFIYSDMVVFNRCDDGYDRAMFKRVVRAVNRRTQVLYETPDGEVEDNVPEEMPFDLETDIVNIEDDDFGIFYIDAFEHLDKYINKTFCFTAMLFHPEDIPKKEAFIAGRKAMTCCAEDISFVGFPLDYAKGTQLVNKSWSKVTGTLKTINNSRTGEPIPIFEVEKFENTKEPEEEVVYFY